MSKGAFTKKLLFDALALDHKQRVYDDSHSEDDLTEEGGYIFGPWSQGCTQKNRISASRFPLEDHTTCCSVCSQFCICRLPCHIQALSSKIIINWLIVCTNGEGALRSSKRASGGFTPSLYNRQVSYVTGLTLGFLMRKLSSNKVWQRSLCYQGICCSES